MKFLKNITLLLCFTLFSVNTNAQIDATINPIGILFGDLSVGADLVLTENISVEGTIGIGGGNDDLFGYKYFNLPITAVGKYYFNPDEDASKFYADVFVKFVTRSYKDNDDTFGLPDYNQTRLGAGMGIGYKVVSNNGIVFDIGFGVGRAFINSTNLDDDDYLVDWTDVMIQGKLGIGYRFGNK